MAASPTSLVSISLDDVDLRLQQRCLAAGLAFIGPGQGPYTLECCSPIEATRTKHQAKRRKALGQALRRREAPAQQLSSSQRSASLQPGASSAEAGASELSSQPSAEVRRLMGL